MTNGSNTRMEWNGVPKSCCRLSREMVILPRINFDMKGFALRLVLKQRHNVGNGLLVLLKPKLKHSPPLLTQIQSLTM